MILNADSNNPNSLGYYIFYIFILILLYILVLLITNLLKTRVNEDADVDIDYYARKEGRQVVHDTLTKEQRNLRFNYLLGITIIRASIWVKAPYIFALYNRLHGFTRGDIGILYAVDNLSSLITGPIIGSLGDLYGRKKFCVLYCFIVITQISIRLTGSVPLAYVAQFLTGVSGSIIETAFESWLNFEANFLFTKDQIGMKEKNSFLREIFAKYYIIKILIDRSI